MPIKQGTNGLGAIYQGANKISAIYKGSDLVYQIASADPNVIALIERTITNVTADMIGNITEIGANAFIHATLLKNIDLPEGITSIGAYAFQQTALTNIILPSTITSISVSAFAECGNLKTMTILAVNPPTIQAVSDISEATTTIYVPASSVSAYQTAEKWKDLMVRGTNPITFIGI